MTVALCKRPIAAEAIDQAVSHIVRQRESEGDNEIRSSHIGEIVMKALLRLDPVGYIRYASVYKDFRQPEDFNEFLQDMNALRDDQKQAAA